MNDNQEAWVTIKVKKSNNPNLPDLTISQGSLMKNFIENIQFMGGTVKIVRENQ